MRTKKPTTPGKGNKSIKRALKTKDAARLDTSLEIPLIVDTTELITPEIAKKYLDKNKNNRKISWPKVREYQKMMEEGKWRMHSQGIIFDENGYLLTGQKRLYAVMLSGTSQYFRVSRGTPAKYAHLIDRGTPQSARDLASRHTERSHSPTENSIVRAIYALSGRTKINADDISEKLVLLDHELIQAMEMTRRIKKTKPVIMIMAAICQLNKPDLYAITRELAEMFEERMQPSTVDECWNKGAAFTMAMERALKICKKAQEDMKIE